MRWFEFESCLRLVEKNEIPHCIYLEELQMLLPEVRKREKRLQNGDQYGKAYKLEFGGQPGGELFMTCCGCSRTEPLHCFGPAMKPHYLIHYVLNGRGIFKMEGEEYPLEAGCGF